MVSNRERRASLPGVDELFRSTARPAPRRPADPDEGGADAPADVGERGPASDERDDIVTPMRRPGAGRPEASQDVTGDDSGTVPDEPATPSAAEAVAQESGAATDTAELVRAAELSGSLVAPRGVGDDPSPAVGAVLGWAAVTVAARQVVEVDVRSAGVGRWIVSGMPSGGTMTLIGADTAATLDGVREALQEDDPSLRVRTIPGDPGIVLERLADGGYDLVVVRATSVTDRTARGHVVRLLRAGGVLVVVELDEGEGRGTSVVRELAEDPRLRGFVVPAGGGALVASRT